MNKKIAPYNPLASGDQGFAREGHDPPDPGVRGGRHSDWRVTRMACSSSKARAKTTSFLNSAEELVIEAGTGAAG